MTRFRDEMLEEFGDIMRGLLMESFAESKKTAPTDHAATGNMMYRQMVRGKELLNAIDKFYESKMPKEEKPPEVKPVNGTALQKKV